MSTETREQLRGELRSQLTEGKAVILQEPGCLAIKRVAVPRPGPGEVLVRVMAATTCGTDLKAFQRGHPQIPMPGVFGHEYSGVVAHAGPGAAFEVGDEVMGVHSAPCQACFWCSRDQENLCAEIMATKILGAYAEYLLVPAHIAKVNLFTKPPALSFERASLLEPLACVVHGLSMVSLHPDDRILILGPGAIGLMFAATLIHAGQRDVTLVGRNPKRLALGERLGARVRKLEEAGNGLGRGYDLVIECTGNEQVWESSLGYARRGGQVMLFGGCPSGSRACFDTRRVHYDQISILSPFHFGTRAVRKARELLLDPTLELDLLLSGDRRLEEAEEVFRDLESGRGTKYVFRP